MSKHARTSEPESPAVKSTNGFDVAVAAVKYGSIAIAAVVVAMTGNNLVDVSIQDLFP